MHHICLLSGGHSSAIVAIEIVRKFGSSEVILLNHDINPEYEDEDIKRFKKQISEYLGIAITYANYGGITDSNLLPDQFDIVIKHRAFTSPAGNALCTAKLKTEPFKKYLDDNFIPNSTLFEERKDCIIYYGFDMKEKDRITRRVGIMASMGYRTAYPLATMKERTIFSTKEIGIDPPLTYDVFEHANCKGCLKASMLHWYVVYVYYPAIYARAVFTEEAVDFTIHTIIRNKIKRPISLKELSAHFEKMKLDGVPATEHQSKFKFANLLKKYQIEESIISRPCECLS